METAARSMDTVKQRKEPASGRGNAIAGFWKCMTGQISISDYLASMPDVVSAGCGECICQKCLYYHSDRCSYGHCYDDKRAKDNPYDKAHPDRPPRTVWSNWNKPGEQAHWCRGGTFYPLYSKCEHFVKYTGVRVEECIWANILVYQDGYRECSLVDVFGCETCYDHLMEKLKDAEVVE